CAPRARSCRYIPESPPARNPLGARRGCAWWTGVSRPRGMGYNHRTGGRSMVRWHAAAGLLVLGLLPLTANPARADRVPSSKVAVPPSTGTRVDITVPYLTNGTSALGVANGVAPRIYNSPQVDDPTNPQARAAYNLPFYGGSQAFGDKANGVVSRPKYPFAR